MANVIWIIIGFLFCAIAGYGIGLHRGFKTYEHEYDKGYADALSYCEQHYEMTEIEPMLDDLYEEQKYEKAKQLVKELEGLFEDDNVIDGGYYD